MPDNENRPIASRAAGQLESAAGQPAFVNPDDTPPNFYLSIRELRKYLCFLELAYKGQRSDPKARKRMANLVTHLSYEIFVFYDAEEKDWLWR